LRRPARLRPCRTDFRHWRRSKPPMSRTCAGFAALTVAGGAPMCSGPSAIGPSASSARADGGGRAGRAGAAAGGIDLAQNRRGQRRYMGSAFLTPLRKAGGPDPPMAPHFPRSGPPFLLMPRPARQTLTLWSLAPIGPHVGADDAAARAADNAWAEERDRAGVHVQHRRVVADRAKRSRVLASNSLRMLFSLSQRCTTRRNSAD